MMLSSDFTRSNVRSFDSLQPEQSTLSTFPAKNNGSKSNDSSGKLRELDARLNVLETAILEHATVLRDRIGLRLDRLEQKLQHESSGLRRAMEDQTEESGNKIIQLTESLTAAVDRVEMNQQSSSVKATMEDLIAALAATRNHLDTLAQAVATTRAEVSA